MKRKRLSGKRAGQKKSQKRKRTKKTSAYSVIQLLVTSRQRRGYKSAPPFPVTGGAAARVKEVLKVGT